MSVNASSRLDWAALVNHPSEWRQDLDLTSCRGRRLSKMTDITLLYPEAIVGSSDALGWQNIRLIQLRYSLKELVVPPTNSHCLLLNLGNALRFSAHLDERRFEGEVSAGEIAVIPADSSWICRSQSSQSTTLLLMYFRPLFISSVMPDLRYSTIRMTPQIGFRNKQIRHVAMSLLQELNEANAVSRLYADALAHGMAMQLVRRYSSLQGVRVGHGGMAPHKLRKAVGIINRHLIDENEGRVPLRIVAKEVGMSYFHFSRAFKRSMGMSPTNYIAERRIERAKALMNDTQLPLSEIALRSGFSSQSHFNTSFRRMAGSTPKGFRAAV